MITRTSVFHEPGRFAGWPANYGLWHWDDEFVSIFVVGWLGPLRGVHARDTSRPFEPVVMRSRDGGRSWHREPFTGAIPGGVTTLSGDEHVDPPLKAGPKITAPDFMPPTRPIDFTDPETLVLCARTDLAAGSRSWFYVSRDRTRTWEGPHAFPDFGLVGLSARTDLVPFGPDEALFLLTTPKNDGSEGRVVAVWTGDGGRTFERRGWIGVEPRGWMIMPSSLRAGADRVITAVRCSGPREQGRGDHWIELYRSDDRGHTWTQLATPVADTGSGGNPPALVRLPDGRILLLYGYRDAPSGLRGVISSDDGATWPDHRVITDDVAMRDMGYPRAVALADGTVVAVFYANQGEEADRYIEAVRWIP